MTPPPTPRAVYDAMVMLQWAALPPQGPRRHATVTALSTGRLRLAMSRRLLDELRGLFFRPELQARLPSLTPGHAAVILQKTLEFADWFESVPARFSLPQHPKDDHLFDLAIESRAAYLVTWETRLLKLREAHTAEAKRLRRLAPKLAILTPGQLADALKLTAPLPEYTARGHH